VSFEPSKEFLEQEALYARKLARFKRMLNFFIAVAVLSTLFNLAISWVHLDVDDDLVGYTQLIPTFGSAVVVYVAMRLRKV
jgi:hypothetical protein